MVHAFAEALRGTQGRRASPIAIGAASPMSDRLALMRAFRPLHQRWHSSRDHELDEERTADLTAEIRAVQSDALLPVLRPRREAWFEVDLILEADDAILLWSDTLAAFAQALRDTGAFRSVRRWRLLFERDTTGAERPMLQNMSGGRMPASTLNGAERRLILFATHGSDHRWRTGHYATLLANWSKASAVAILPLLPERSWRRTALGEADGTCSTDTPGTASAFLDAQPYWWSDFESDQPTLALPLVSLSANSVSTWAAMLMSRGKPAPATLLSYPVPAPQAVVPERLGESRPQSQMANGPIESSLEPDDIELRIAMLREVSPAGFELAVLLSQTTFTIPVARLIQEAHFGKTDQSALSELFVSGLLVATTPDTPSLVDEAITTAYYIHHRAAELLRRSLRGRDARALAEVLMARVSEHIQRYTNKMTSQTVFTLDEKGIFALPASIRPFAIVAAQLRNQNVPRATRIDLSAVIGELPPLARRRLIHIARQDRPIDELEVEPATWRALADPALSSLNDSGQRSLSEELQAALQREADRLPLLGTRILWVDDRPSNNLNLVSRFNAEGVEVETALSTLEGLDRLNDNIDLIISDMGRAEGEREGLVLLNELRANGVTIPVIIFAAGYSSRESNRSEAIQAGASLCTNNSRDVYDFVYHYLLETAPKSLKTPVELSLTERGNIHALIIDGDHDGSRIHERSGGAFAIMLEGLLRVPTTNIHHAKIKNWLEDRDKLGEEFRSMAEGDPDEAMGTVFIYAAAPASIDAQSATAGPSIQNVAAAFCLTNRVEQVILVVDSADGIMPSVFDGGPIITLGSPADEPPSEIAPQLTIMVGGKMPSERGWRGTFGLTETADLDLLPMTRAIIEAACSAQANGRLDGQDLVTALKQITPTCNVSGSTRTVFSTNDTTSGELLKPWAVSFKEGVNYANQRSPRTDELALQCYRRALALIPDNIARDQHAQLIIYCAAMEKRLNNLDDALDLIRNSERVWIETRFEDDAWYNIASTCALLDRREEMLDALFKVRGSKKILDSVMAHRDDYFAKFAHDPDLQAFLVSPPQRLQIRERLPAEDFYTSEEILALAENASNERPRRALRTLATQQRQNWVIVTGNSLLLFSDDLLSRDNPLTPKAILPIAEVEQTEEITTADGEHFIIFRKDGRTFPFEYSPDLFSKGQDIQTEISWLIIAAKSR